MKRILFPIACFFAVLSPLAEAGYVLQSDNVWRTSQVNNVVGSFSQFNSDLAAASTDESGGAFYFLSNFGSLDSNDGTEQGSGRIIGTYGTGGAKTITAQGPYDADVSGATTPIYQRFAEGTTTNPPGLRILNSAEVSLTLGGDAAGDVINRVGFQANAAGGDPADQILSAFVRYTDGTFSASASDDIGTNFTDYHSYVFEAPAGLGIDQINLNYVYQPQGGTPDPYARVSLHNLGFTTVAAAVPEPGVFAAFTAVGLAGTLRRRRRPGGSTGVAKS